jgi:hypothetical protein
VNLNSYDKGYKPYYSSMDPYSEGGQLKMLSKKRQKFGEKNEITDEKEKEKQANTYKSSLNRLLEAYQDVNESVK